MNPVSLTRRSLLTLGSTWPLLGLGNLVRQPLRHLQVSVCAPFDMPPIRIPDFSSSPHFPITQFGADEGDQDRTSAAIARAIAAAHVTGSGIVLIPPGVWPTAKIHLRSNVNLHLGRGATLKFSANPADYLPAVPTSWEGIECYNYSPLIYAYGAENIAITGEGTLQATMDAWSAWIESSKSQTDALIALYYLAARRAPVTHRQMTAAGANLRPHFIQFNRCRHVVVEGIRVQNSPFWVLHPFLCKDVVVRRLRIEAHSANNDGIDPEMSQNVLIEHCVFDQGDDAIAVKSGRDHDGWRIGVPSKNIVVRSCLVKNGHQLISVGSELSAGVENIFVHDCEVDTALSGRPSRFNNVLFVKTNERRGGYARNIFVSGVTAGTIRGGALRIDTDVLFEWRHLVPTLDRRLTRIAAVTVANISARKAGFLCRIAGDNDLPVKRVVLSNVQSEEIVEEPIAVKGVKNFINRA